MQSTLVPCKMKLTGYVLVPGMSLVNPYTDNLMSQLSALCILLEPPKWVCTDLSKGSYHESKHSLER